MHLPTSENSKKHCATQISYYYQNKGWFLWVTNDNHQIALCTYCTPSKVPIALFPKYNSFIMTFNYHPQNEWLLGSNNGNQVQTMMKLLSSICCGISLEFKLLWTIYWKFILRTFNCYIKNNFEICKQQSQLASPLTPAKPRNVLIVLTHCN